MKRTIGQWSNCEPKAMATYQSEVAVMYALQDAKDDILELYRENLRLKNISSKLVKGIFQIEE